MGNDINLNEFICKNILYINDKLNDQIVKSEYEKYFETYKNNFNIVAVDNLQTGFKFFFFNLFFCMITICHNINNRNKSYFIYII